MTKKSILLAVIIALIAAGPAIAKRQSKPAWAEEKESDCNFCIQSDTTGLCSVISIFESSYLTTVSKKNRPDNMADVVLTADFGLLFRLSPSNAVGASVLILSDDDETRWGIRARYRRWLDENITLDLTAGYILPGDHYWMNQTSGLVGSASFGIKDKISFDLVYERFSYTPISTANDWSNYGPSTDRSTRTSSVYFGLSGRGYYAFIPPVFYLLKVLAEVRSWNGNGGFSF